MFWKIVGVASIIYLTNMYVNYLVYEQCNTRGYAFLLQGQIACFPAIDAHLGNKK